MKSENELVYSVITEPELKNLSEMAKRISIPVKGEWKAKRQMMYAILKTKSKEIDIQTKIEKHANTKNQYKEVPFNKLKETCKIISRGEFDPSIDSKTGEKIYWVTDPDKSKRQAVLRYGVTAYIKRRDEKTGKIISIKLPEPVYINYQDATKLRDVNFCKKYRENNI